MSVGHSRVPVYFRNPTHIIGLILVPISHMDFVFVLSSFTACNVPFCWCRL